MKKILSKVTRTMLVISIMILAGIETAAADTTEVGTPGGVVLTDASTIQLCTKTIPVGNIGWGVCADDAVTKGTFSYEPSGHTLRFNAEASGLGGYMHPAYPEVSDLILTGVTKTTLRWTWTTPDRPYFIKNIVTVKETVSGTIILGPADKVSDPNETVHMFVGGLTEGTSYTITVQSAYNTPTGTEDHSYSLIYYRDTDPNNINPSEKGYKLLDQAMSVNGVVDFSGYQFIGENIPMASDVNAKGKIWIVPTSELNEDGTLKWTGYGAGNIMTDYLFESDNPANDSPPPTLWLGGITYTYTSVP